MGETNGLSGKSANTDVLDSPLNNYPAFLLPFQAVSTCYQALVTGFQAVLMLHQAVSLLHQADATSIRRFNGARKVLLEFEWKLLEFQQILLEFDIVMAQSPTVMLTSRL
ncbi:MAG TPA: hypothetical protein VFX34_01445 [Sporosarcina sp.]|nr:hypothetical protein [Sporosarcina sp.]